MRHHFEEVFKRAKYIAIARGVKFTFAIMRKKILKYFDELSSHERSLSLTLKNILIPRLTFIH